MQDNRFVVAASWLHAARIDLDAAQSLLERLPPPACFHAQQSAEKSLKAVLVALAGDAPRTHVVGTLRVEIEEAGVEIPSEIVDALRPLDQYYLPTRYPDALGGGDAMATYSVQQAAAAVESARRTHSWAEDFVTSLRR